MSKGLSSPKMFQPYESRVETIIGLLEKGFEGAGGFFDKPVDHQHNMHSLTIRIDGTYELADTQEVCRRYREAGWDDVQSRRVDGRQTSFTFKQTK